MMQHVEHEDLLREVELARAAFKTILLGDKELPSFRFLLCSAKVPGLLEGNNPAIYVNKKTAGLVAKPFEINSRVFTAVVYLPEVDVTPPVEMMIRELQHKDILISVSSFRFTSDATALRSLMILIHEMAHGYLEEKHGFTMEQDAYAKELGLLFALCHPDQRTVARSMRFTRETATGYLRERASQYAIVKLPDEVPWFMRKTLPYYQTIRAWCEDPALPALTSLPAQKHKKVYSETFEREAQRREHDLRSLLGLPPLVYRLRGG